MLLHNRVAVVHNRVANAKKQPKEHTSQDKRYKEQPKAQRAEAGHLGKGLSNLEEDLNMEPLNPLQAMKAVEANQSAPEVEGMVKKRAAMLCGFGPSVWHNRYFLLDPREGVLRYWEPANNTLTQCGLDGEAGILHFEKSERPTSAPKHTFMLRHIMQVESNRRHRIFQVIFCKPGKQTEAGKVLHLQAATEAEFNHWLKALQPYGMRQGPTTPSNRSKSKKTKK